MELSKKQEKAKAALARVRASNRRWTWQEIEAATGIHYSSLCGIHKGNRTFSDAVAERIIAGARKLK